MAQVSRIRRAATRTRQHVGTTPPGHDGRRVETSLIHGEGGAPRFQVSRQVWGRGVGWYTQQSLDLSLDEARRLVQLLEQAPAAAPEAAQDDVALPEPVSLAAYRARRR